MSHRPLAVVPLAVVRLVLALGASFLTSPASAAPPEYAGDSIIRVVPADLRQLRAALIMADDVWSHGSAVGRPLDLLVDADSRRSIERAGLKVETLIPDVGVMIAAERKRLSEAAQAGDQGGIAGTDAWFADFKNNAQINTKLDELVAQRPDLCSIVALGNSLEGRPIRAIRISNAPAGAPAIVFNGCQHAREWVSPMTVMYIANRLVDDATTDPQIAALLQQAEIFVIPVVNPDGYQYSWDVNRLWRKNRRNNGNGTFGVDLNRNWDYQWGGAGASSVPSDETYRGPFAFSEPESQAMRDFFLARPNVVGHIDFHSYSQLVLSPWGYTLDPSPDAAFFNALGQQMAEGIFAVNAMTYIAGPIGPTLYLASGSSVDWVYGSRGAFSFTIELRDTGTFGFVLPPEQILPTAKENFVAAMILVTETIKPIAISFPQGTPSVIPPTGATVTIEVTDIASEPIAEGATLWSRTNPNAAFVASPIVEVGSTQPSVWTATLPATPCGATLSWYVDFATNRGSVRAPSDAPATVFSTSVRETTTVFADDFESNTGWSVDPAGPNASSGQWVRVDPNGTAAQPENDSTVNGTMCFVTGQGPVGGSVGTADVDGGTTTLVSPMLNCSDAESRVQYDRWYSNNQGSSPNSDSMPVDISNDGGLAWTPLELVTENAGAWVTKTFRVADFVAPSPNVVVRFIARDLGAGSIVEAGVDGFRVFALTCPDAYGDLNGDGVVDASDLAVLLGAWGSTDGSADLNGDGIVNAGDLAVLLGAWS